MPSSCDRGPAAAAASRRVQPLLRLEPLQVPAGPHRRPLRLGGARRRGDAARVGVVGRQLAGALHHPVDDGGVKRGELLGPQVDHVVAAGLAGLPRQLQHLVHLVDTARDRAAGGQGVSGQVTQTATSASISGGTPGRVNLDSAPC